MATLYSFQGSAFQIGLRTSRAGTTPPPATVVVGGGKPKRRRRFYVIGDRTYENLTDAEISYLLSRLVAKPEIRVADTPAPENKPVRGVRAKVTEVQQAPPLQVYPLTFEALWDQSERMHQDFVLIELARLREMYLAREAAEADDEDVILLLH